MNSWPAVRCALRYAGYAPAADALLPELVRVANVGELLWPLDTIQADRRVQVQDGSLLS